MLRKGAVYHIYNRGNNRELLFREATNYRYFLSLCRKFVLPAVSISAWCLIPNHYHFLARIRTEEEQYDYYCKMLKQTKTEVVKPFRPLNPSRCLSNAFSTYALAYNKKYNRTGSLFQDGFRRREARTKTYKKHLVHYIHYNPAKHGMAVSPEEYQWSSLSATLEGRIDPWLKSNCRELFGSYKKFTLAHSTVNKWLLNTSQELS